MTALETSLRRNGIEANRGNAGTGTESVVDVLTIIKQT